MSSTMYRVKPVHHTIAIDDLPTCMYKMKNQNVAVINGANTTEDLSLDASALVKRQENIISKLEALQARVSSLLSSPDTSPAPPAIGQSAAAVLPKDLVIACNPSSSPRAALYLLDQLASRHKVLRTCYVHSTTREQPSLDLLKAGFQSCLVGASRTDKEMVVTWIWKNCENCEMVVSPVRQTKIVSEVNICRYLTRLLGEYPTDPVSATVMDQWLDIATDISYGTSAQRSAALSKLAKHLSKSNYVSGASMGTEDVIICSAFIDSVTPDKWLNDASLKKWCGSVRNCFQL